MCEDILGDLWLSSRTIALKQLQLTGRIRPVVLLSGTGGAATVNVDPASDEVAASKGRKMHLMATALAVSTAGYVFETDLQQPMRSAMRVAGFLLRSHQQRLFRIARIGRRRSGEMVLGELRGGIAQPDGLCLPYDLDLAFDQDAPGQEDRDRAWHQLKEMGVEFAQANRALN